MMETQVGEFAEFEYRAVTDNQKALRNPQSVQVLNRATPNRWLTNRYNSRPMLETAFAGFQDMVFTEEELEMQEGTAHGGMSAVIGFTCRKPK